jgi:hypothetical protein
MIAAANAIRRDIIAAIGDGRQFLGDNLKDGVWHFHANRNHAQTMLGQAQHAIWQTLRSGLEQLWRRTYDKISTIATSYMPYVAPLTNLTQVHIDAALRHLMPETDWTLLGDTHQYRKTPQQIANMAAGDLAHGKDVTTIVKEMMRWLSGSCARAGLAARTFATYINTDCTFLIFEQCGTEVVGYRVCAQGGATARDDHERRHGHCYWRYPEDGQSGFGAMPYPPWDRGGPHEHESGLRRFCRCWMGPIIGGHED